MGHGRLLADNILQALVTIAQVSTQPLIEPLLREAVFILNLAPIKAPQSPIIKDSLFQKINHIRIIHISTSYSITIIHYYYKRPKNTTKNSDTSLRQWGIEYPN
jgi:hypothetical protein